MNKDKLNNLIKKVINETIDVMTEEHDHGEWWIDETGGTTYCDNQVSDQGHESVVIQALTHEILGHFGIEEDEPYPISDYEDTIKQTLINDGRLEEDELAGWDNIEHSTYHGPADIIVKKLLEDKVYADKQQAEDAVYIAYGSNTRDARDWAMRWWRWKVMKTFGGAIEIQTWHLKPDDLQIIVRGIWDIMRDDSDDPDDSDNEVGEDNYTGPRINVTVQASGKRFSDIPLAVLEKKMPQMLQNYSSGAHVGYAENINEEYSYSNKDYRIYEGNDSIIASFNDGSRLKFEVHYHNNRGDDKEKWRRKAFSKWKSLASEIHNDVQLSEVGNKIQKSWKESFKEALDHPDIQEYIRKNNHQKIYPK